MVEKDADAENVKLMARDGSLHTGQPRSDAVPDIALDENCSSHSTWLRGKF